MSASPESNSGDTRPEIPELTVAMIVRDAAELLDETLDTVRGIADEIVVLDTGSEDDSVRIARKGGARVFETTWGDDFAAARNACAKHVTGDWILWLDAGETLDEEPTQQIRNFVDRDADSNKAYMLFVQLPSVNPQLSGEQIGQIRLVPRRPELRFVGPLRETLLPSVLAAGMEVDALPCQILRPVSDHDPARKAAKAARNLRIIEAAEKRGDGPDPAALQMARAEACQNLGRLDDAAAGYRETITTAQPGSSAMLEAYYGLLTTYDGRPEESETQIATCLEALDVFPLDAQLLCGMGSYLLNQQRIDLAARSYEIAATHGQIDPATWHLADITEVAATCLSLAHQLRGDADDAIAVLERALEQRPDSTRMRRQLLEILIKNSRRDAAMGAFDALADEFPCREATRTAVRGALLAAEKNFLAAEPYLKTAYSAGCRDTLCLRWLAITYLSTGNLDAAEPIITEWRAFDPADREAIAYQQAITQHRQRADEKSTPAPATMPTGAAPAAVRERTAPRNVRIDEPAASDGSPPIAPTASPTGISDPMAPVR
jgi:tetratricopeptide (TPR) repeat protein